MDESSGPGSQLQEQLDMLVKGSDIDHAVLELEWRGWHWAGASGNADATGRAMTPEIPWFIASIDKLFTATLVLQLHEDEQHDLDIDDLMVDHLHRDLVKGIHRIDGTDHTGSITLRHLLGHGSGLPDYLEDRPAKGPALVDTLVQEGDRDLPLAELLELVRRMRPHFRPRPIEQGGQRIRYNSTGFSLLNAVLEARTGMTMDQLHQERIYKPLGLVNTSIIGSPSAAAIAVPPASLRFGANEIRLPLFLRAIESMHSTGAELIRFLRALLKGELFRDPKTLELMTGNWNSFGFPTDRASVRSPSWPIKCALGLQQFKIPRWLPPFRDIPSVMGHTGSTGSWLFHCPRMDLYLAGTVDQGTAGAVPYRLVPKVLEILRKEISRTLRR
jgi:D-alanyl-D-alanine carboxypeptidase